MDQATIISDSMCREAFAFQRAELSFFVIPSEVEGSLLLKPRSASRDPSTPNWFAFANQLLRSG